MNRQNFMDFVHNTTPLQWGAIVLIAVALCSYMVWGTAKLWKSK